MHVRFDAIAELPSKAQVEELRLRQGRRESRRLQGVEQRRARLLTLASALYLEHGAAGFNMRDLAHRAGYTVGALYGYFDSKDAIFLALRQEMLLQMEQAVSGARLPRGVRAKSVVDAAGAAAVPGTARPGNLLEARALAWLEHLQRHPQLVPLLLAAPGAQAAALMQEAQPTRADLFPVIALCAEALVEQGCPQTWAWRLCEDALAFGIGLLVLHQDDTGADQQAGRFLAFLRQGVDRWQSGGPDGAPAVVEPPQVGQTDLF